MELFPARSSVHPPIHNRRSRGLLIRLRDVDAARRGFEPWGLERDLSHADMELLRPTEGDRRRLRRVALVDGTALLALFFFAFVLPMVTADPLEGPILSPGVGVCRQMAETLHENPSGSGAVEPPALLDNGIAGAVDDGFVLIDGGPMELGDDPTSDRLRDAGFVRGFSGRWASPRGELFVEVTVLGDADEAEDYNTRVLGETCTEASEVFAVASVPGAVGMRWFTNQGLVDQISFASDEVHVFVAIADEDDEPDRRAAVTTAEGVAGFLLGSAPL
jgi:hypothetical protein